MQINVVVNYYYILASFFFSVIITFHVLLQLKMFEQMGFKVDHASPIYKRFRLKVLGAYFSPEVINYTLIVLFQIIIV